MKISPMLNALALAALTAATLSTGAVAQDGPPRGPFPFEEMDANKDGKVTKDEMTAHREARFTRADTDKDGKLSAAELAAAADEKAKERSAKRASKMIERADKDGDGMLTMAEMTPPRGDKMFDRADTDGDGAISKAEADAAREKMGKRGRGHRKHHDSN